MKILFLTDNFPPEVNAPATRTFEHLREWVARGAEVTVITCFPNFPGGKVFEGYQNRLYQEEKIEGIRVLRVWSYITPNKGIFKRTLDYMSYAMSAVIAGLWVDRPDVIVATSPQFFTAVAGRLLSGLRRIPWVMEIRDLWPESILAVGAIRAGWIVRLLEKMEIHMYRHAKHLVVVTDSFKERIVSRGIPTERISVIKNGVDLRRIQPAAADLALKRSLGLEQAFVVGYIGTHGMAHGLEVFVRSAHKLPNGAHLLFIGDGAEKEKIQQIVDRDAALPVTLHDPIPRSEIPRYLSILDAALVPLCRRETFKTVIPSKIFEAAAMGVPILLGVEGEAEKMIEEYGAGLCFTPEDIDHFISQLERLMSEPQLYKRCQSGGELLAGDYSRQVLAVRLYEIVSSSV